MGTITINGKTYKGNNITVTGRKIIIDGIVQNGEAQGVVELKIEGDVGSIKADCDVTVTGSVKGNIDSGGSVDCGDVTGDVDAGGSVRAKNVGGNIDAGGSVDCENVEGDIDAGGSVRHK